MRHRGANFIRATWLFLAFLGSKPSQAREAAEAVAGSSSWSPGHRTTAELPGEVHAPAATADTDGVYGRFGGDLAIALAVGAEVESQTPRALAHVSAHYYWTAGVYASYRETLGDAGEASHASRLGSVGIDIRPLFIPRWSLNWQTGPAVLDLLVDSISIGAGAFFAKVPSQLLAQRRGFEASLGAGLPLLGQALGPWLSFRYAQRWPEAGASARSFWLTLGWHAFFTTPLASRTGALR